MSIEQIVVFAVLLITLVLFVTERWRYDVVALLALLAVTLTGIVPAENAFVGFGHPAVVTVAAVLVVGQAMINSGLIDTISRSMLRISDRPVLQVAALTSLCALFSALMNNVAAVALLMPVGIQMARRHGRSPSLLLMPLAYGSLLGGMTTLIGTPPNIIIATFRAQGGAEPFSMFDFLPVGLGVAAVGIVYISLLGWRLIPQRKGNTSREDLFHIKEYSTEIRVPQGSDLVGKRVREIKDLATSDVVLTGVIRNERRYLVPMGYTLLEADDILLVQGASDTLHRLIDAHTLELVGDVKNKEIDASSDDVGMFEAVVTLDSPLVDSTIRRVNLRQRYGINLLAVARQGTRLHQRLADIRFAAGDVLLLQGPTEAVYTAIASLGCLPLAERGLRIGRERRLILALAIFGVAILVTTLGLLPIELAMLSAAVAVVLARLLSLREAYSSIEWPVLILLGSMIPVAEAMERTGGADLIANGVRQLAGQAPPVVALTLVLVVAMILTPLVNNAAAALLMAPIAVSIARSMGVSPDAFLMATAIGVSCDFLTPIGHQSNTLVMGPGGYKFGDYWRMGLLIEVIVIVVSIPLLLVFWPL